MKRIVLSLAAAVAALMLGCQNPDLSNPVASVAGDSHGSLAMPPPVLQSNLIDFDQKVFYRIYGRSAELYRASGSVSYQITKIPTLPACEAELYEVEMFVSGEIGKLNSDRESLRPAPWKFEGKSKDRIRVAPGTKVLLEKKYAAEGATVPTVVLMSFTMTENALSLQNLSLAQVKAVGLPASNHE